MMACALFLPEPKRIVQLGLGAAALAKFCYRNITGAQITAVELSERVIDTARRSFGLPPDDDRLEVVQADARDYLGDRRRAGRADWLQVDLYDAAARGPVYDDPGFYTLCRRTLRRPGVACFNLFGRRFEPSLQAIRAAFGARVVAMPEVDEGNRIVFGLHGSGFEESLPALERRARSLEAAWKLPFARWLADLSRGYAQGDTLRI
jgi:spermidine synthase